MCDATPIVLKLLLSLAKAALKQSEKLPERKVDRRIMRECHGMLLHHRHRVRKVTCNQSSTSWRGMDVHVHESHSFQDGQWIELMDLLATSIDPETDISIAFDVLFSVSMIPSRSKSMV